MPVLHTLKRALNSYRFGIAVRPHRGELVKMIDRRVGCLFDAEDIVQTALERAYIKWLEHGPEHFTAFPFWLRLVTFNALKDHFRALPVANDEVFDVDAHAELMGTAPSSLDLALAHERAELFARAVGRLPEELRHVLVRRELELMEVHEIAEALGVTTKTAQKKVERARRMVIEEMER